MIVTCPDCQTRYQINGASLKPPGRRVRCQNCEVVWFQEPEKDKVQPTPEEISPTISEDTPPPTPDDVSEQAPEGVPDVAAEEQSVESDTSPQIDVETEAARLIAISKNARQQRRHKKTQVKTALGGWMMLAACVCAFIISGAIWRKPIVKLFPAAADLYAAVYLPVNIRGIEFKNITSDRKFENGIPVLTIRGELANITDEKITVPDLRFGLQNASNQELYHWTMKIKLKTLPPAGQTKFVTRLASPPGEAQNVQVRFVQTDG